MSESNGEPVLVIPRMPCEFIKTEDCTEIAPGYVVYRITEDGPGCIMRIGTDPLYTIGDWMGYIGWNIPEEEKDDDQKQAEKIMKRQITALHDLTLSDKVVLTSFDVNIEKYKDYSEEVKNG